MSRLLPALVILVAPAAARAADPKAAVDPLVREFLQAAPVQKQLGLVVGVWAGGQPHVYGYGTVVTPAGTRPPDGDTIFEIASVTKVFTGLLLAEAVRRKEVELADPAAKHLPAPLVLPPAVGRPITLLDLATHRSGLPRMPDGFDEDELDPANPYAGYTPARLAAGLAKTKPGKPGETYEYSNLGAGLLGHALVRAAKADGYHALVVERVCKPLGMSDTGEALTGVQRARLAAGHDDKGIRVPTWDFASLEGGGCLRSTARDMLRFAAANVGEVKSPLAGAIAASHEPRSAAVVLNRQDEKIGLGWLSYKRRDGNRAFWHNGGTYGGHSFLAIVPGTKTAVVILGSADVDTDDLGFRVLTALQPKAPPKK